MNLQADLQTHVSTLDVVSRFQQKVNKTSSSSNPDVHSDPCSAPEKRPDLNCMSDQNTNNNSRHISIMSTVHSVDAVRGGEWTHGEGRGLEPTVSRPHTEHSQVGGKGLPSIQYLILLLKCFT